MDRPSPRYCSDCGKSLERFYSIESAATLLDCSQQFFRNLVRDRKIGFLKVGRLIRIPQSEIERIAEAYPALDDKSAGWLREAMARHSKI